MEKYKLLVDTSCDLPTELVSKYNIGYVPLVISIGDKEYRDRIDITPNDVMKMCDNETNYPKTCAAGIVELGNIFKIALEKYDHLYFMSISSKSSSIYQNAVNALNQLGKDKDRVTVLDSKSLSGGFGVLAMALCEDINLGLPIDEIVSRHNDRASKCRMMFSIDSMKYLYRGGRCSGLSYLVGNAFHIHPIANMSDGKLSVFSLTRGKTLEKTVKKMVNIFLDDLDNRNVDFSQPILIPHVMGEDGVDKVIKILDGKVGDKILIPVQAGCTVTTHTGSSDTVGLSYLRNRIE